MLSHEIMTRPVSGDWKIILSLRTLSLLTSFVAVYHKIQDLLVNPPPVTSALEEILATRKLVEKTRRAVADVCDICGTDDAAVDSAEFIDHKEILTELLLAHQDTDTENESSEGFPTPRSAGTPIGTPRTIKQGYLRPQSCRNVGMEGTFFTSIPVYL